MGDMTRSLSRREFACKCNCGFDTVDFDLPFILQDAVDHFQKLYPLKNIKIRINSGCRCDTHNAKEGGTPRGAITFSGSQHLHGKAADFYLYDGNTGIVINPDDVAAYLERKYPNSLGIGYYKGRTHVDTRPTKKRWDKR